MEDLMNTCECLDLLSPGERDTKYDVMGFWDTFSGFIHSFVLVLIDLWGLHY